ncbi:MAG TPA: MFS transporter [Tepidisphaeraceae bacterium]
MTAPNAPDSPSNASASLAPPRGERRGVPGKLSGMMFLQYAVWGVWLQFLANYLKAPVAEGGLGFTQSQIGWLLGTAGSLGAITGPFIAGQVADRYLNAERALGLLLLIGGVINFMLAGTTEYTPFLLLSIAYSIVYMPTLSLTNSIAFANLSDPERRFPPVRLWGTIGWVVASIAFTKLWLNTADPIVNTQRVADALRVSGALSILYALYALFLLPKTPPKNDVRHPLAFAEAFGLLRLRPFLIVTLMALPIAMIHQVYFFRAGPFFEEAVGIAKENLGFVFSIGQASEVFFLLILGLFIKRLGYKWVLITGALAYAARFGLFAVGQPAALVIASQLLHGLCYGCFFAGSFLLVERLAGESIRHSAQTVFGIIILGLGPILAAIYNERVLGLFDTVMGDKTVTDYHKVWAVQAAVALVVAIVLLITFPNRVVEKDASVVPEN